MFSENNIFRLRHTTVPADQLVSGSDQGVGGGGGGGHGDGSAAAAGEHHDDIELVATTGPDAGVPV